LRNRKVHVKPKYCVSLSSIVDNYVLQINVLFVYVKLMEIKYKFMWRKITHNRWFLFFRFIPIVFLLSEQTVCRILDTGLNLTLTSLMALASNR